MGTMAGLEHGRPGEVITGPVARGDLLSIGKNRDALSVDPNAAQIYRVLGEEVLTVALEEGLIEDQAQAIRAALGS